VVKIFVFLELEQNWTFFKGLEYNPIILMLLTKMVEAAGVEPASENLPRRHLHTCPEIYISPVPDSFRLDA